MTKTTIKTSISDSGITISDNQGNSFHHDKGFVEATCGGKKQDINLVAVAALGAKLGANIAGEKIEHYNHKHQAASSPFLINAVIPSIPNDAAPIFKLPDVQSPSFQQSAAQALVGVAKSIQAVDTTVTLKEGIPSPLTGMCAKAQAEGLMQNRK